MTLDNYKSTLEFLIWFPGCTFFFVKSWLCPNFQWKTEFYYNFFLRIKNFFKKNIKILQSTYTYHHTAFLNYNLRFGFCIEKRSYYVAQLVYDETYVLCTCSNTFEEEFFFPNQISNQFQICKSCTEQQKSAGNFSCCKLCVYLLHSDLKFGKNKSSFYNTKLFKISKIYIDSNFVKDC